MLGPKGSDVDVQLANGGIIDVIGLSVFVDIGKPAVGVGALDVLLTGRYGGNAEEPTGRLSMVVCLGTAVVGIVDSLSWGIWEDNPGTTCVFFEICPPPGRSMLWPGYGTDIGCPPGSSSKRDEMRGAVAAALVVAPPKVLPPDEDS